MPLIILLSLLFLNPALPPHNACKNPVYELSGSIYSTSRHQGGAYLADFEPLKTAYANLTIQVVEWIDETTVPVPVKTFTTDAQGHFSITLPPAKYGFTLVSSLDPLTPGQWLPQAEYSGDLHYSSSTWWECSVPGPIDLTNGAITGLELVVHNRSTCGTCP